MPHGLHLAPRAAMGENVADLADADHLAAGLCEAVEQRRRRGEDGVVLAVARALEVSGAGADEGPGDHAADVQRIAQRARRNAHVVKPLQPERRFVGRDLQYTVGRGVDDRHARGHVLDPEFGDDRGARGVLVAEDARQAAAGNQIIRELLGKAGDRRGKVAPVERHRHAADFPVPRHGVLAPRNLHGGAEAGMLPDQGNSRQGHARRNPRGVGEAEAGEVWDDQRSGPQPRAVSATLGAGGGDVAERVGALVAEVRRIARAADAHRVHDDEKGPGHRDLALIRARTGSAAMGALPSLYADRTAAAASSAVLVSRAWTMQSGREASTAAPLPARSVRPTR